MLDRRPTRQIRLYDCFLFNQSLFLVITTGLDIYYIIFRFERIDFLLQRKMQFGHILETFENFNKRKTLVGPQVIPRSISTVKFSINEHHFSATILLRLVGLVTEE